MGSRGRDTTMISTVGQRLRIVRASVGPSSVPGASYSVNVDCH